MILKAGFSTIKKKNFSVGSLISLEVKSGGKETSFSMATEDQTIRPKKN